MNAYFDQWRQNCSGNAKPQLGDVDKLIDAEPVLSVPSVVNMKSLQPGFHPKEVIADLSEGLLAHYTGKPLIANTMSTST